MTLLRIVFYSSISVAYATGKRPRYAVVVTNLTRSAPLFTTGVVGVC